MAVVQAPNSAPAMLQHAVLFVIFLSACFFTWFVFFTFLVWCRLVCVALCDPIEIHSLAWHSSHSPVISPELVLEVESRMNRCYLPQTLVKSVSNRPKAFHHTRPKKPPPSALATVQETNRIGNWSRETQATSPPHQPEVPSEFTLLHGNTVTSPESPHCESRLDGSYQFTLCQSERLFCLGKPTLTSETCFANLG